MGWSLTKLEPKHPDLINFALLAAGKALFLANHFEAKCKFVLRIANLDSYMEGYSTASFTDAIAALAKDKLLGPTISDLKSFPPVSQDDAAALDLAKDARNFIAHGGAYFGSLQVGDQNILKHLEKLRAHVAGLAKGDDIVSRWVYEIEEKDSPAGLMTGYSTAIDNWVFGGGAPNNSFKPNAFRP